MAHFDADTINVYQAFSTHIGQYAVMHGSFGEGFSFSRMSWIKTNFMWMMYRSGWGTKPGQEITLAIRLILLSSARRNNLPQCCLRETD